VQQKTYLGQPVGTSWINLDTQGNTILHVSRGDSAIFNTALNSIVSVGGNLTIRASETEDINSQWFGMSIEFVDVVEVGDSWFWCKQIIVRHNTTYDPDLVNDLDPGDNIVVSVEEYDVYQELQTNPNVFNENNAIYISRAIAYENCEYNKVVSSVANDARYKELSLANIKQRLVRQSLDVVNTETKLSLDILDTKDFRVAIRHVSNDNGLQQLTNSYTYPMTRIKGRYVPKFKILSSYYDTQDFENVYVSNIKSSTKWKRNVTIAQQQLSVSTVAYENARHIATNSTDAYDYVSAISNGITFVEKLPWIALPAEFRDIRSLVFNSDEKIIVTATVANNSIVDITDILFDKLYVWLQFSSRLTDEVRLKLTRLYVDVANDTLDGFNVDRLIMREFIAETFLKIYRIEKIVTADDKIVQFNLTDTAIEIENEFIIEDSIEVQIHFTR
jgi:hypothetical protein